MYALEVIIIRNAKQAGRECFSPENRGEKSTRIAIAHEDEVEALATRSRALALQVDAAFIEGYYNRPA